LITIADGQRMPDVRLLFLLGDSLVQADRAYLEEGRQRLIEALDEAPDSPLAGDAWASLAMAAGKLRDHETQSEAYTRALDGEWRREWRAVLLMNRGEAQMSLGDLHGAQLDYERAMAISRSAKTQSLAGWGLAVATERDGDLPTALELARKAASYRFGPPSHPVVSLDLPGIFFMPEHEEHYYRALAAMAEARAEAHPDRSRLQLQTASLLWSLYLDNAAKDDGAWMENARRHRNDCRRRLEVLAPAPPAP
jgi:tetratricopeptide (TPR) repeat protein